MNKKELINPVEFIDPNNKRELINPIEIIEKKSKYDPEVQIYIILYVGNDDNPDIKSYDVVQSRVATYEHIKTLAPDIDCVQSKVIANGVDFDESISVYYFMKLMKEYFNDGFDIEDYVSGDTTDEENIGVTVDLSF